MRRRTPSQPPSKAGRPTVSCTGAPSCSGHLQEIFATCLSPSALQVHLVCFLAIAPIHMLIIIDLLSCSVCEFIRALTDCLWQMSARLCIEDTPE